MLLAAALLILAPQATVHGTVRAERSLLPIAHATVEISELGRGVLTDAHGYFTFPDLPPGEWSIRASALGYGEFEASVMVPERGTITVALTLATRPVALEGITVRGRTGRATTAAAGSEPFRIDASVVEALPVLAEPDIFRALQTLPSVQAASDFSSALYVRGGLPDQNLIMLDGAPLFNPFHLGGLFSAFDPSAIATVEMLPGGFPAPIGDRLSSAIDIRTKEGGQDRVRGSGAVGLISSRMSVDGPLPGGGGSYLLSARRTYLDLFTDLAQTAGLIDIAFPYGFTDAHLKLTSEVGRLGRLSASFYVDAEDFEILQESSNEFGRFDWGSRMASVGYWQPLGASWVVDVRGGVSDFYGVFGAYKHPWSDQVRGLRTDTVEVLFDARTIQRDLFAAADFTGYARKHTRRLGVQIDRYLLDHAVALGESDFGKVILPFERTDRPFTLAAYAEDEWKATPALSLRGGLRVLHAGEHGSEWLPRLGVRYAPTPRVTLSAAGSRSAQVLRSLRSEESIWSSLTAYDLLVAVPKESGLTTAEDLTIGVEWRSTSSSVRVDAYQKWMHDLPVAPVPADIMESPMFATDSTLLGEGRARGLEVLARHARGRGAFSLSYALTFAEISNGEERYTPRFERRHLLDASAALPLGRRGRFTSRLAWATGQSYTPILGRTRGFGYDPVDGRFTGRGGFNGNSLLVGDHNSARLPRYFRLDVGARREFTRTWWDRPVQFTPYLSILNVLNTSNVLFAIPEGYDRVTLEYPPQIPILPTFGIEWKF